MTYMRQSLALSHSGLFGNRDHFGLPHTSNGCDDSISGRATSRTTVAIYEISSWVQKARIEDYVCELMNSTYSLKQAPLIWYNVLQTFLTPLGFVRYNKEYCIYMQKVEVDEWVIVVVYVDDLAIMSRSLYALKDFKRELSNRSKMKDLGDVHYLLKMEIRRSSENMTISISQKKYTKDLFQKVHRGQLSISFFSPSEMSEVATGGKYEFNSDRSARVRLQRASWITAVSGKRHQTRRCKCRERDEQLIILLQ